MRRSNRALLFLGRSVFVALSLILLSGSCAAAEFVGDFLKKKDKWPELVGLRFALEGRLSTGSGHVLLLRKLSLAFHSESELPDLSGKNQVVEVVGELRKDSKDVLFFELLTVTRQPTDLDRLADERRKLDLRVVDPWYRLGDWAVQRGTFYSDDELIAAGRDLYRAGIRSERNLIRQPDGNDYRRLAEKVSRLGLEKELQMQFIYEAHLQTWQKTRRDSTSAELITLASIVSAELPGANQSVDDLSAVDRPQWLQSPLAFYESATVEARQRLHRYLYQQIMREGIEKQASPDGRNGQEIAALFRLHLPEMPKLADEYRDRELAYRRSQILKATRAEMLVLCEDLEKLGRKEESEAVFREWFQNRERELRLQGVDGLVELASEYETLIEGSQQKVVDLLMEVERKRPGSNFVAERLEAYGYRMLNGKWAGAAEAAAIENLPINRAMREGRVIRGMTASQVRRTLGEPAVKSRLLTARNVVELWSYGGGSSTSRLTVRMARSSRVGDGVVIAVVDGSSPTGANPAP